MTRREGKAWRVAVTIPLGRTAVSYTQDRAKIIARQYGRFGTKMTAHLKIDPSGLPSRFPQANSDQGSVSHIQDDPRTGQSSDFALPDGAKLLKVLLENASVGVCMSDAQLRVILHNQQLKHLLDYPDQLFDRPTVMLEDLFRFNAERGDYGTGNIDELVNKRVALAQKGLSHVYQRETSTGTVIEVRGFPIEGGGFVSIYSDVTEQRKKTNQLEAIVSHFPGGICLFDEDMRMVQHNAKLKELLDYPEALFADGPPNLEQLFRFNAERGEYGPGRTDDLVRQRLELLKNPRHHEYRRKRPNGTVVEVRGGPVGGGGFITTYVDVTEEYRNQELIVHMAHHDSLTDLPNRTLLMERLRDEVARAKRGFPMALLYLDLDKFKPVNDTLGHAVGDQLLRAVADRLRAGTRETDTVARLGGDEFVVVQTGINDQADACVLAERLVDKLCTPFEISGADIQIGTSIGIALAPEHSVDAAELLKLADKALYRTKTDGGRGYTFAMA